MALVGELSKLTKEYNSGKGVPVRYELTSLESIQSYLNVGVKIDNLMCPLQHHTILGVTEVFDEITEAKLLLNDFCNDVKKYQGHLPEKMRDQAKKLQQEAKVAEAKFTGQLQILLVAVRSGKAEVSKLDDLREEYEIGPYLAGNVLRTLREDFHDVQLKIEELQGFTTLGVAFVSKHTRYLPNKLLEFKGKQVFVLFSESEAIGMDEGRLWGSHLAAIRKLAEDPTVTENSAFLFVDLDVTPHLKPHQLGNDQRKICLQKFNRHGECVDDDVYKEHVQETSLAFAKSDNVTRLPVRTNYGKLFKLPCPESQFSRAHYHEWTCFDCKDLLTWDFDEFFYCSCGVGRADSYKFRCPNSKLDQGYCRIPQETFKALLEIACRPSSNISENLASPEYVNQTICRLRHLERPLAEIFSNCMHQLFVDYRFNKGIPSYFQGLCIESALRLKKRPLVRLRIVELETTRIVCTSGSCVKGHRTEFGIHYREYKSCEGPHNHNLHNMPLVDPRWKLNEECYDFCRENNINEPSFNCNSCGCPYVLHMREGFYVEPVQDIGDKLPYSGYDKEWYKLWKALGQFGSFYPKAITVKDCVMWSKLNYSHCDRDNVWDQRFHSGCIDKYERDYEETRRERGTHKSINTDVIRIAGHHRKADVDKINSLIEKLYNLPGIGSDFKKMADVQEWRWKLIR